jgi:hypothetical protein
MSTCIKIEGKMYRVRDWQCIGRSCLQLGCWEQKRVGSFGERHEPFGLLFYTSPFLTNQWREYDSPIIELEYFGEHRGFQIPRVPVQPGQPPSDKYGVNYGFVGLSKVGQELVKIAGAEPVEWFFDFLELQWIPEGISRNSLT